MTVYATQREPFRKGYSTLELCRNEASSSYMPARNPLEKESLGRQNCFCARERNAFLLFDIVIAFSAEFPSDASIQAEAYSLQHAAICGPATSIALAPLVIRQHWERHCHKLWALAQFEM